VQAVGLLILSNVFMTFVWYAHLKNLNDKPWWVAALASWAIALFELPATGAGQPHRLCNHESGLAENHAGGDHAGSVHFVRHVLYATTGQAGLSLGRSVFDRWVFFMFRAG
jgi:hypothetical protein